MTAVEWLANELYEKFEMKGDGALFNDLLNQAKEMEKQQIMDARLNGFMISGEGYNGEYPYEGKDKNIISTEIDNEQYYNETFKKDNETEWSANYIQCDLCNHKWASVYPNELDRLECPNCSNMVMFETFNK
jgi:DNA-directed RNA polymerase subunit RPC12/RpoP